MRYTNWKIGTRLAVGFAVVLLLLALVAGLGISRMAAIQARLTQVSEVNNVKVKHASVMRRSVTDRMLALRNMVLLDDQDELQREVDRIKDNARRYAEAEDKLSRMFAARADTTAEEKAMLPRIKEVEAAILPLMNKAAELGLANRNEEAARMLLKEVRPLQNQWTKALGELTDLEDQMSGQASDEAEHAYGNARLLMLALSGGAVVAGALIAWLVAASITRPIGVAVQAAQRVAGGDLSGRIAVTSSDETGQLLQALKDMNESLGSIVGEVRQGTDTIAAASVQIASGNLDLSARTEQQASSLEETASSIEELTSTVRQNADNARHANQLAISACEVAEQGGAVVAQVVETMDSINASAGKIADIIGVIDGIAFQTNILALNAAVEAARAGEQGRGFAVVASEVRNLAQRSAAAAREIKGLIGDSVEKADAGARLVNQAGSTMQAIVASVRSVTDIMAEISAASQEQTAGIEQINQAIVQMDDVTQQNAALVEQAAAASQSLQDRAAGLSQAVSVFTIDGALGAAPAAPAARAAPRRPPALALRRP